ncbi:hypothetical protein GCM10007205_19790 [Oxalicibacterium flavum]|uniref:Rhodanese domain-containing protein n=1 Tax=Oxalicibacterium flavum TaxID=179467 RepID=A0A8J2UP38_9BURK|nr:rhodanese-like domain-containing protein [Oxalicibacterium flavum]GGC10706.1 hypothetical protein GCM10007205_19790 [Oxalicibacterium flavum]
MSNDILDAGRARGRHDNLPYAGALTPQESHALLLADPRVKLIDVRTDAERDWIGKPAIAPEQQFAVQWNLYPGGARNPDFLQQLEQVAGKDDVLLFLCRGAVRSKGAAKLAAENGYVNSFDVLEGFEGGKDANGHRNNVDGWRKAGLPWIGA